MGMFSYVTLEMPCPYCGHVLKEFQSKDGIAMKNNEPWTLQNFYTSCPKCRKWVEYIRKGSAISTIDLIDEGKQAVALLKELSQHIDYIENKNNAPHPVLSKITKFLQQTNYPIESINWLDWYSLKE